MRLKRMIRRRSSTSVRYPLHLVGSRHQRMDVWRPLRMRRLLWVAVLIVVLALISALFLETLKASLLSAISADSSSTSTTVQIR